MWNKLLLIGQQAYWLTKRFHITKWTDKLQFIWEIFNDLSTVPQAGNNNQPCPRPNSFSIFDSPLMSLYLIKGESIAKLENESTVSFTASCTKQKHPLQDSSSTYTQTRLWSFQVNEQALS